MSNTKPEPKPAPEPWVAPPSTDKPYTPVEWPIPEEWAPSKRKLKD